MIDSYYISQLLKDINNKTSRQKFHEVIKNKAPIVKTAYDEVLSKYDETSALNESLLGVAESNSGYKAQDGALLHKVERHFCNTIAALISETAAAIKVPEEDLRISFNEYSPGKGEVPHINMIISKSAMTKEDFECAFPGEKFRRKIAVIGEHLQKLMESRLHPLREELANFGDALEGNTL